MKEDKHTRRSKRLARSKHKRSSINATFLHFLNPSRKTKKRLRAKAFLFVLLFSIAIPLNAQWDYRGGKAGRLAIKSALMTFAGAMDGLAECSKYHYPAFSSTFPNHNPNFWSPQSWRNKWKNGDPAQGERFFGSSTFLVWTTDGYHMSRMARNFAVAGAVTIEICGSKKPWQVYLFEFLAYMICYNLGFTIVYDVIIGK